MRFHLLQRAQFTLTHLLLATYLHKCKTRKQSNESAIFANCFQLTFPIDTFPHLALSTDLQSLSALCFMHLKTETSPDRTTHKTPVHMQPRDFFQTPLLHEIFHLGPVGHPPDCQVLFSLRKSGQKQAPPNQNAPKCLFCNSASCELGQVKIYVAKLQLWTVR